MGANRLSQYFEDLDRDGWGLQETRESDTYVPLPSIFRMSHWQLELYASAYRKAFDALVLEGQLAGPAGYEDWSN